MREAAARAQRRTRECEARALVIAALLDRTRRDYGFTYSNVSGRPLMPLIGGAIQLAILPGS